LTRREPRSGGERILWSVINAVAVLLVLASFAMVAGLGKRL